MTADHLDEVAELERICFSALGPGRCWRRSWTTHCSAFLVAQDDRRPVVGYAGLQVVLDEGYITNVAVRPEHRRKGIAAQLLEVFIDFAQGNHLAFLTLEVRPSNTAAIGFTAARLPQRGPAEELL